MALIKCTECGTEVSDQALTCPKCGAPIAQPNQNAPITQSAEMDIPDTSLNIISFIVPLAGLIIYLLEKETKPIKAKACAKWALRGVVVWIALWFIYLLIWPLLAFSSLASLF